MLLRVIHCFLHQSYPAKELIIVYEDDDVATHTLLQETPLSGDIRPVCVPRSSAVKLGELRNISIRHAAGEFICQWDDDDWYHPERLSAQYKALMFSGKDGCIMTQWTLWNAVDRKAYLSNIRTWEGSILCRKSRMLEEGYVNMHAGEDSATIVSLLQKDLLHLLTDQPQLYVYSYHGHNTWNWPHWKEIFECSTQFPRNASRIIDDIMSGKVGPVESGRFLTDLVSFYQAKISG